MAFVYILKTDSGKYYIGSTVNVQKRVQQHCSGSTPTTKRLGNPELIFSQEFLTLTEARKIERRLKRLKRRDYIEKIIKDGYIKIGR